MWSVDVLLVDYMTMKWANYLCVCIGAKVIHSFNIDPMFATMEIWKQANNEYIPQTMVVSHDDIRTSYSL